MRKNIILITLVFAVIFPCFVFAVSLEEILNAPAEFDSKAVEIEAEVIGNPLKGVNGVWLNVKSGESNIGVFSLDAAVLESIKYWGSYGQKGDKLKIKGIFYKNCPLHQISDIHLNSLAVIEKGCENKMAVSSERIRLAVMLFIICLTTGLIYFIKKFLEKPKNH